MGAKNTVLRGSTWELNVWKAFTGHRVKSISGTCYHSFSMVLCNHALFHCVSGLQLEGPSGGGREVLLQAAGRGRPQGRKPSAQQVGRQPPLGHHIPSTRQPLRRHARSRSNASGSRRRSQPSRRRSPPPLPAESRGLGPAGSRCPPGPAGTRNEEEPKGNSRACPAPPRHAGKELPGKGTGLKGCRVRGPVSPLAGRLWSTAALARAWGGEEGEGPA